MNSPATPATNSVAAALANARQLLGQHPAAAAQQAREIIRVEPGIAEAHLILASALRRTGDEDGSQRAEREALRVSTSDPVLKRAEEDLTNGREADGEALVRRFLRDSPNDPEALRLLGVAAVSAGHVGRAEDLARQALALVPSFPSARELLDEAIEGQAEAYTGVRDKPQNPPEGAEEFAEGIQANEKALSENPEDPRLWLSYGHILRIAGRHEGSKAAYRKAVEIAPRYGEAWWSLVDLKTVRLTEADIAVIRKGLESERLSPRDRAGLLFALGRGLEDLGQASQSFEAYQQGNSVQRRTVFYDGSQVTDYVSRCEDVLTREFFATRAGAGHDAHDPIFILGMPRSGSTLVEQILASHPQIEGTDELVFMTALATLFTGGRGPEYSEGDFISALADAPARKFRTIGGSYLWKVNNQRRSSRSFFIDKMPRNWLYLPLILLALPNAKIIDVRRNAMDCCWSNFRQLFANGGEFSYDLTDLGHYYRDYARLMEHIDSVLPGRMHRVIYEDLVEETEAEVRRMLDYIGVPFDERCVRFQENRRAVKTASSEQVRRPISRESIGQWHNYESWLEPLKQALGRLYEDRPGSVGA